MGLEVNFHFETEYEETALGGRHKMAREGGFGKITVTIFGVACFEKG